jgi:hypothetical protein
LRCGWTADDAVAGRLSRLWDTPGIFTRGRRGRPLEIPAFDALFNALFAALFDAEDGWWLNRT